MRRPWTRSKRCAPSDETRQRRAACVMVTVLTCLGTVVWKEGHAQALQPRTATVTTSVTRATGAIHLDGRLDEADWSHAAPIGLTQQAPLEGQPPTELTEIRVLYDAAALYFGVVCFERHPGGM